MNKKWLCHLTEWHAILSGQPLLTFSYDSRQRLKDLKENWVWLGLCCHCTPGADKENEGHFAEANRVGIGFQAK
jgi:hypothetical protein